MCIRDRIDTAGIYIKGRADTPELSPELVDVYEQWEFTDDMGVSNGLTYLAYCPTGYMPNNEDIPRAGCDMILAMRRQADRLKARRLEEALGEGRLTQTDINRLEEGDEVAAERVKRVLDTYYPGRSFSEFFDLQQQQEMARFHNELSRHFFFVR